MTPSEYIAGLYPDLHEDPVKETFYITLATDLTSSTYFGTKMNYAIALRAIHMFLLSPDVLRSYGQGGFITGMSEGNTTLRFANPSVKGKSDLHLTSFGQQLASLIGATGPAISVSSDENGLIAQIEDVD